MTLDSGFSDEILKLWLHHATAGHAIANTLDFRGFKIDQRGDNLFDVPAGVETFRSEPPCLAMLKTGSDLILLQLPGQIDKFNIAHKSSRLIGFIGKGVSRAAAANCRYRRLCPISPRKILVQIRIERALSPT